MVDLEDGRPIIDANTRDAFQKVSEAGYGLWYALWPVSDEDLFVVVRHDGVDVGSAEFSHQDDRVWCQNVKVNSDQQRKGLATAMYVFAEVFLGKTMVNMWGTDEAQTDDAKGLWASTNRPFGREPHSA